MHEVELKFQVPRGRGAAVQRAVAEGGAQTTRLQAIYADTADHRLAANQMALRLRKEGRVWVQTLKGRGDGLMQRLEHEVPLPAGRGLPVLDVQRHASSEVGQRLIRALDGAPLQTLYRTDIRRLHRVLAFHELRVELAYDRGWLIAGDETGPRRLAVNEIEFELKAGSAQLLPAQALHWAAQHGLWWDCRTKSERGMRLALDRPTVPATPAQPSPPPRDFKTWQAALRDALAHALPNAAEIADGLADDTHRQELRVALSHVADVLASPFAGPYQDYVLRLHASVQQLAARTDIAVRDLPFNSLMLSALGFSLPLATGTECRWFR